MATGDLKNNLRKLQCELRAVKYNKDVDFESLGNGVAAAYLPIYHYMFVDYSRPLAEKIAGMDVEMFGKTDYRFVEAFYKVMREMFSYKPPIRMDQFFAAGFGERKVIMCTEILQLLRGKHHALTGISRSASARVRANQTLPCPGSRTTSADHEAASKTRPLDYTVTQDITTDFSSPAIVSRVVSETCSSVPTREFPACVSGESRAAMMDDLRQLCSSPDELRLPVVVRETSAPTVVREPPVMDASRKPAAAIPSADAHAIQNAVLTAMNKINALGSHLNTLDERLGRLESLERRLAEFSELDKRYEQFSRLERRVTHLERSSAAAQCRSASPSGENINGADSPGPSPARKPPTAPFTGLNADLLTNQLNNLTARMTLAENKLTMLQQQQPATTSHALFPSPESISRNIQMENGICRNASIYRSNSVSATGDASISLDSTAVSSASVAPDAVVSAAAETGNLFQEPPEKCSRSDQLERIQSMLRGTKELLQMPHNDSLAEL